jgi:hypothetical protein
VGARARVAVFLCEAVVNEEELVAVTPDAHHKVVGLEVAVEKVLAVNILDAANHLRPRKKKRMHYLRLIISSYRRFE